MTRTALKLVIFDSAVLLAIFLVLNDLIMRNTYAQSRLPTTTYSLFIRFFSTTRAGLTLTSPPILDWVQVLVAVLAVSNAALVFRYLRRRGRHPNAEGKSASEVSGQSPPALTPAASSGMRDSV